MFSDKVYFSKYIDEENILTYPSQEDVEEEKYRYKMTIPFKNRDMHSGKIAVVIMKNPSKAGKLDGNGRKRSDDTIYLVLDYLYKRQETFCKVIIINLFGIFGSTFNNIEFKTVEDLNGPENNEVIRDVFEKAEPGKYKIIAAWGGYPKKNGVNQIYRDRIEYIFDLAKSYKRTLWSVGDLVISSKEQFPAHGKSWYDYEEINEYIY